MTGFCLGQITLVEGYVNEDGSQNYLLDAEVSFYNDSTGHLISSVSSEIDGYFSLEVDKNTPLRIEARKALFQTKILKFRTGSEEKVFIRLALTREEGYLLTVTLSQARDSITGPSKSIFGAYVRVLNNTKSRQELEIDALKTPHFTHALVKGNHYTIAIRKENFLSKRIQSYVDIEGCVLCFEGVDKVRLIPNDSLHEGLSMGALYLNVEMLALYEGQSIELDKVQFEEGESKLNLESKAGLQELAEMLRDNEGVDVEIGSHSDARGDYESNLELTFERASVVVDFLSKDLGIERERLVAVGYGEAEIRNRCMRGINCTESEHKENRRTVAKVIRVDNRFEVEENVESMEAELDLISTKNLRKTSLIEGNPFVDSTASGGALLSEDLDEVRTGKRDSLNGKSYDKKIEALIEIVESAASLKRINERNNSDSIRLIDTTAWVEDVDVAAEGANLRDDSLDLETYLVDTLDNFKFQDRASKVISESLASSHDYSGYKVVVHYSNYPIPANHEIYTSFEEIEEFQTREKNMLYLIGAFETIEEAESQLRDEVSPIVPGAYIIRFFNGKKINYK